MPFNPWTDFGGALGDMRRLEREMNRLFRQFAGNGREASAGYPAVNIWEDDDNLFLEAELPGIAKDALDIHVTGGNQLVIKGRRQRPQFDDGAWHRQERVFGEFSRVVSLPSDVQSDGVTATMKYGVLTLQLPKREEVKPRKIKVRTV